MNLRERESVVENKISEGLGGTGTHGVFVCVECVCVCVCVCVWCVCLWSVCVFVECVNI